MKIGIDIRQCVYEGTGVGEYTVKLVTHLIKTSQKKEYVLFFSNRRIKIRNPNFEILNNLESQNANVKIKSFTIPIPVLEFLWNRLHIVPIEWLIGSVDVFVTSDWLEPPASRAKKVTTIHDLSVLKFPDAYDDRISHVHRRKLKWVSQESDIIMCDSKATKQDAINLLGIAKERLKVV